MKSTRILLGTLFFVGLVLGAVSAYAGNKDVTTSLEVTKPYYSDSEDYDALPEEVDPEKFRIRIKMKLVPSSSYLLSVKIKDITQDGSYEGFQNLVYLFNGYGE